MSSLRPASADAVLGGSRGLGPLSAAPLPATGSLGTEPEPERSPSPEFTDSDISPLKPDEKHYFRGQDERKSDEKSERKASKNSRLHSAVATSSDFGSPGPK